MGTFLDEYKRHYGLQHDGAAVLKHAEHGHFRDPVTNDLFTADKLEKLGITAEMSREQVIDCLSGQPGTIDKEQENVVMLHRYVLQQIIDFCSEKFVFDDKNKPVQPAPSQEIPLMERISLKIIDPIFDAIGRRLYTGSFKKRKRD